MAEKIIKILKKQWLLIWMILAVTALVSTVTFAAWTRVKRVKRVVSVQSETGMRFSSNYMGAVSPTQTRNVAMGSEDNATVEVVVRNYAQGNVSRVYPHTFTYTLKATLCYANGNPVTSYDNTFANYSIKTITDRTIPTYGDPVSFTAQTVNGQTNYIATITRNSLTGGKTDEDYFLITFDEGQKTVVSPTYYVKLEAILDKEGDDIENLAGYVGLYAKASRNGWDLSIADNISQEFGDFHGFNYALTGSGEGAVKISWNPDELSISSLFLKEIGATASDDSDSNNSGMKCVCFPVNSSEVNYYDIQFYKTEEFDMENWSELAVGSDNVKCSYEEAKRVSMTFGGETVEESIEVQQGTGAAITAASNYDSLYMITLNENSYHLDGGSGYSVESSGTTTTITVTGSGTITLTKSGTSTVATFSSGVLETGDNTFAVKFFENGELKIASGVIDVTTE